MEEQAEADEPHIATLGERVYGSPYLTVKMVKQQRSTAQSERPNTKRNLATGRVMETTLGRDGETRAVKVKWLAARTFAPFPVPHAFFSL